MTTLGGAIAIADEVQGFQYFDRRDLLGFVDGTENPEDQEAIDAALIGGEDPDFAGGSYVIVQKYLHDLAGWNGLTTEAQERIIGRTKLGNDRTRRCDQADLRAQRADHRSSRTARR